MVDRCIQRSLLPHLNECLSVPLSEQEKWLEYLLEIVEMKRHVSGMVLEGKFVSSSQGSITNDNAQIM